MEQKIHQGRNIKRFREMLGIKQEALAYELGEEWNQKKISLLEQKEEVDTPLLQQISQVLHIPVEAFKNFDEEQAINIISNTFHDFKDNAMASAMNYRCKFDPIDKIVELYDEKIALYERMLKEKDEMMARLEKLIGGIPKRQKKRAALRIRTSSRCAMRGGSDVCDGGA
jgi:transcriptional regulator with XRE-family HTH domain